MAQLESLGKYHITEVIGRGAMGVVYKAFDPNIRRSVAVKTVRRDMADDDEHMQTLLARFRNEAQAAGRLSHPGIVAIYDYGEQDGLGYIAMEYVEGNSLREYLTRGTRFSERDVVSIMSQLLAALAYSHEQGVWHRDIKPANLIVMQNGKLKIADFGIARIDSSDITHTGAIMGTPGYMAPEQYVGTQVDARADVFSAGVVMYELLSGVRPFTGRIDTIAHKVCHEDPPRPSHLVANPVAPAVYDAIIARAIAKQPGERFQTAGEFRCAVLDAYAAPVSAALSEETIITETLFGKRPEPTHPPTSPSGATAPSGERSTAPPPGWDPELLMQVERHFARFMGPVAKALVRRTGRQTLSLDELYARLAAHLASDQERAAFMATRSTLPGTPSRSSAPPTSRDAPLTPEKIEAAQRALAAYIGPIARLMARKAAADAASCEQFYSRLAEGLAASEREHFLEAVGSSRKPVQ